MRTWGIVIVVLMLGMACDAGNKAVQEDAPAKEEKPESTENKKDDYTAADLAVNEDMQAELDRLHDESYDDNRDDLF